MKRGLMEHIKQIVAWELLFILVFSSLLILGSVDGVITGKATSTITKEDLLTEIENSIVNLDIVNQASDFSMCLIVNMDSTTKYSYEILKISGAVAVTIADEVSCKGQEKEDFIVSYVSYNALKEHLTSNPSLSQLKATGEGTNFYLLPSKEVLPGAIVANPNEFNQRFGDVVRKNLPSKEANLILSGKSPETQSAASSLASYVIFFIGGLVLLVIIAITLIINSSKKPNIAEDLQIVSYIKSSLAQGYTQEQITQSLIQSGWSQEKISDAFKTANSEVSMPNGFQ